VYLSLRSWVVVHFSCFCDVNTLKIKDRLVGWLVLLLPCNDYFPNACFVKFSIVANKTDLIMQLSVPRTDISSRRQSYMQFFYSYIPDMFFTSSPVSISY
jgi:hypothetical protein